MASLRHYTCKYDYSCLQLTVVVTKRLYELIYIVEDMRCTGSTHNRN